MITFLLHLLRLLPSLFGGHRQLALETSPCASSSPSTSERRPGRDYAELTVCSGPAWARVWAGWRQALVIVSPDTVLRWQRRRVREYWTRLSGRSRGGTVARWPSLPLSGGWPAGRRVQRRYVSAIALITILRPR